MNNWFDLEGKVALITGGTRGIGFSLAKNLAELGVDIAVIGYSSDETEIKELVESFGRKFLFLQINLLSRNERKKIIEKVVTNFGTLDILINNAGRQYNAPASSYELETWDQDIELMLTAVLDLSQQAYEVMKNRGGKIIHIASISSFQGARNIIGYTTAKHGLIGMTKSMSNEWAKENININAIAPGIIETDMSQATTKDSEHAKVLKSRIPSGRFGKPEDLVGAVVFLSSQASCHVNGSVITVDGGWLGR